MDGARTTDLPLHTPLHYPLDHHGFIPTMHESLVFQPKISRVRAGSRAARDESVVVEWIVQWGVEW